MRALIILIDGGDPAYFERASTPNLDRLARGGGRWLVRAQMPTVTNVNNVSMICGHPPSRHGITANYFLDRRSGREVYMESGKFLMTPTLMERGAAVGYFSAVLASKQKLLDMIGKGSDFAVTAENPPKWLVDRAGKKEDIYSGEVNLWLLRAAREVIHQRRPSLIYVSTTDYIQHMHGPEAPEAQVHTEALDAEIGRLVDAWDDCQPDGAVFVTADHGMRDKRRAVDPGVILRARGVAAEAVPIIKDRYVVHHGNQGGSAYVHLKEPDALDEALAILRETPGIEAALPRGEAARRFQLFADRVGDIMALADAGTVFGVMEEAEREVSIRSHGSLHEEAVPLWAWRAPGFEPAPDAHHYDATRAVIERLL